MRYTRASAGPGVLVLSAVLAGLIAGTLECSPAWGAAQLRVDPVLTMASGSAVRAVRARGSGLKARSSVMALVQVPHAQYEIPLTAGPAGDVAADLPLPRLPEPRVGPASAVLVQDGRTLAAADLPPGEVTASRLLLLVGPDSDALGYLSVRRAGEPPMPYTVKAVSPVELPERWFGYGSTVAIIADADSVDDLARSQAQALSDWLASGGLLITYPGTLEVVPLTGQLASLAPAAAAPGLPGKEGLAPLAAAVGQGTAYDTQTVWPIVPAPGAESVGATSTALVAGRRVGLGTWVALAVDPTTEGLAVSPDRGSLWQWLFSWGTPARFAPDSLFTAPVGWQAAPPVRLPSGWTLAVVGVVYVVLVGPVNFFLLRRYDRRDLAWATIPAVSVVFTLAMFGVGLAARGGPLESYQMEAVAWGRDADVGVAQLAVTVFSPRSARYHAVLAGDWVPAPSNGTTPDAGAAPLFTARYFKGGVDVADILVPRWSARRFAAAGVVRQPAPLEFDFRRTSGGRGWTGAVRNVSRSTVDVWLCTADAGGFAPLGTLAPNQSRSVSVSKGDAGPLSADGGRWERLAAQRLVNSATLREVRGSTGALVAIPQAPRPAARVPGAANHSLVLWIMPLDGAPRPMQLVGGPPSPTGATS